MRDGWTDRDRWMDAQTDRRMDVWTDGQTDGWTDSPHPHQAEVKSFLLSARDPCRSSGSLNEAQSVVMETPITHIHEETTERFTSH